MVETAVFTVIGAGVALAAVILAVAKKKNKPATPAVNDEVKQTLLDLQEKIRQIQELEKVAHDFKNIKNNLKRIMTETPKEFRLSITINGKTMTDVEDLAYLSEIYSLYYRSVTREMIKLQLRLAHFFADPQQQESQLLVAHAMAEKVLRHSEDEEIRRLLASIKEELQTSNVAVREFKRKALREWYRLFKQMIADCTLTSDEIKKLNKAKDEYGLSFRDTRRLWKKAFQAGLKFADGKASNKGKRVPIGSHLLAPL